MLEVKDKMSVPLFALLAVCVDVSAVMVIGFIQLSSSFINNTFILLWAGGLLRTCLPVLVSFSCPGIPAWMRGSEGMQTAAVHGLVYPVYISSLWACDRPIVELVWGWHTCQGLLQGYVVLASLLLWKRHASTLLLMVQKEKTERKDLLQRLLGCMKPFSGCFVAVFFLIFISSLGEMAIPHYTGKMTDWIMNEDEPKAFNHAITVMTLITVMSAVCEFVCDLMYNSTMSRIHTSIQGLIFQSVLKQEIGFFDKSSPGCIESHITTATNEMSTSLSENLSLLMWHFMRFVFLLGSMVRLSRTLTFFTVLILPIIWIIPEYFGQCNQKLSKQVQDSLAKANDVAKETFSSMKTVRSFANEDGETERYRMCLEETYALNKKEAAAYAASTWTNSMSSLALKVCILYYGGRLVTGSDVSSGDLVSFVLYELQFSSAMEGLMSTWPKLMKAVGASEKNFEYIDRKPDIPPDGSLAPETLKGHVQFKNITFAYPKQPDTEVLKNVSLELKPGQITALVGPSGSGKSTIVSLLERFYQPRSGNIFLDQRRLVDYKDQYLHEKISVVPQEPLLFARSVQENIKYGKEDASDEEMYTAAKLANADDFILNLPRGYDTDAGEKGGQVSGGQKQRIAIARALIRKPQILVLDDATSSLDTESEHRVYSALRKELKNCTVLLITHRLSGVENADHIIFLREGEVAEEGNHEQLLAKHGFYAEFVKQQKTSIHRNTRDVTNSIQ
ncbi:antigen peptide transporter 1 isoform X3 [Carassius gibelio]|uniref:antigen peptide transporter 1 isoform X2 n=1 Tax=Carassius gibelio TaxID=101364 RepID=UPI00227922B8|nr:antigen peptide transporter 1 isoform X2 [Carassius gibelio]XP_052473395.1 antigen peptide transporter 1 isoform X3 [Carassius gibelio]